MQACPESKSRCNRRLGSALLALFLGAGLLPPGQADAAWTQRRGTFLVIPSLFHYVADRQLDAAGHASRRPPYIKDELRLYSVYGLTDSLTLGVDGAARRVQDALPGETQEPANWSETSLFVRYRVAAWANSVVSVQPLVYLPRSKGSTGDLGRETDTAQAEFRVLYGTNYHLFQRDGFAITELGFRRRFGPAADQMRFDSTVGVRVWPRVLFLLQSFNTKSLRAPDASGLPNYDLYKAQVSAVRDLTPHVAVQFGAFTEYAGRNTGAGRAGFVALWLRF